tara:strand:- start:28 stop:429 length:402 start_codon:yes stop_codon:yes gene_type:complete
MKKISLILAIILIGCSYTFKNTNAQAHPDEKWFSPNEMQMTQVPVYCGNSVIVLSKIMEDFKMNLVHSGDVRTQGQMSGSLIGTVSYWHSIDTKIGIYLMTIPQTSLSCIMAYGLSTKFQEELMLDIVNEEIK